MFEREHIMKENIILLTSMLIFKIEKFVQQSLVRCCKTLEIETKFFTFNLIDKKRIKNSLVFTYTKRKNESQLYLIEVKLH